MGNFVEGAAWLAVLAVLVAVLFSAATCDEPPRVYPAAEEMKTEAWLNPSWPSIGGEIDPKGFVAEILRQSALRGRGERDE